MTNLTAQLKSGGLQKPTANQQSSNHADLQNQYLQTLSGSQRPLGPRSAAQPETVTFNPYAAAPRGMFDAFLNTCQRWRLEQSSQLKLLGYAEQEFLGSQLLMGHMPARTQDVKDRIGYVLAISLGLGTIFNEAVAPELEWLSTKHPHLDEAPLAFMLRGRMFHLMAVGDIVRQMRGV